MSLTDADKQAAIDAWMATGRSIKGAASRLGKNVNTVKYQIDLAKREGFEPSNDNEPPSESAPFEAPELPDASGDRPIDELLDAIEREADRKDHAEQARKLIDIKLRIDGPYCVVPVGDPHLDNAGLDIRSLRRDVEILRRNPAMLAGSVGDYRDNWVGRLAKLFGDQKVSQSEAMKLVQWFFGSLNWLFLLYGNHDLWSGFDDPLPFLHRLAQQQGVLEKYDLRMRLNHPSGDQCFVRVRHDFPGKSQYNDSHGAVKEALWGKADHLMLCGDRHISDYKTIWSPNQERLCHAMRVGTYKRHDPYPKELGLKGENWAASMAAIVNPYARRERDYIQPMFSLEQAEEYLQYLRNKWELGKL